MDEVCDLCGVEIDNDNRGQSTAGTVLCLGCLERVVRKDAQPAGSKEPDAKILNFARQHGASEAAVRDLKENLETMIMAVGGKKAAQIQDETVHDVPADAMKEVVCRRVLEYRGPRWLVEARLAELPSSGESDALMGRGVIVKEVSRLILIGSSEKVTETQDTVPAGTEVVCQRVLEYRGPRQDVEQHLSRVWADSEFKALSVINPKSVVREVTRITLTAETFDWMEKPLRDAGFTGPFGLVAGSQAPGVIEVVGQPVEVDRERMQQLCDEYMHASVPSPLLRGGGEEGMRRSLRALPVLADRREVLNLLESMPDAVMGRVLRHLRVMDRLWAERAGDGAKEES